MANSNYGGWDGSGVAQNAAFAIEAQLKQTWTQAWAQAHPMLQLIKDGRNGWNKGSSVANNRMLVQVVLGGMTTAPAGVSDANELTAMTANRTANFSQAQFEFSHYRANYTITATEEELLKNGARGNILSGKAQQLQEHFMKVIAGDLSGSSADSRTNLMGVLFPLSTSATVGNISQSSETEWKSNVTSTIGTISLPIVDNLYDTITNKNPDGPKVMICSAPASGINTFGRIRSLITPAMRINDAAFKAKFGLTSFVYNDMNCIKDHRMATGNIALIDPSTWFWRGAEMPQRVRVEPVPLTDATAVIYNWICGLAISNPSWNGLLSGITG